MAASDNLSGQQFTAYRAILGTTDLKEPLGSHWSTDHNEPWEYLHSGVYGEKPPEGPHLIVEAHYNPEDDDPTAWSDARKPVVLRPGSKVSVVSITKVNPDWSSSEERFNQPKEMTV